MVKNCQCFSIYSSLILSLFYKSQMKWASQIFHIFSKELRFAEVIDRPEARKLKAFLLVLEHRCLALSFLSCSLCCLCSLATQAERKPGKQSAWLPLAPSMAKKITEICVQIIPGCGVLQGGNARPKRADMTAGGGLCWVREQRKWRASSYSLTAFWPNLVLSSREASSPLPRCPSTCGKTAPRPTSCWWRGRPRGS